ncbi:tripartite tricarboxylate transporter substrate binding protein [Diaphorobacter sp. HDW4A]|uniref:Bug family tripartite tricarboxylate transporter substrate binding protein n=1 Tax=Diaphorobacter sp. HDW4A TaxID=2714924 RepID=UPI00140AFA45|nr:tripartite tricarboxylate transporter substrate binding protein [Diaphorobacter sp. HDW4A]QIL79835.1 tripartite tricarboxylate transporter substrate binding protein [Diaphorobacter sp. HDW4A]
MHILCRRQFLQTAALIALLPMTSRAAAWPDKPLRLVVGFAPGGGSDFVARALAQSISRPLGQQVIVDNRPGAGGAIASRLVATSDADGHTLLLGSAANFVINPVLMPNLPYDADKDFTPVGAVARFGYVLLARKGLPYKQLADVIAHARQRPGELTIGSAGNGSNTHLAAAAFQRAASIQLRHIPYKGTTPALTDLAGGNIDLLFDSVPTVLGQVKAGALNALATTGAERESVLPQLPTMREAGLPGFVASNWFAVFAPARTPPDVVARLNAVMQEALNGAALTVQLQNSGNVPLRGSSAALAQLVKDERASYAKLIKESNITVD